MRLGERYVTISDSNLKCYLPPEDNLTAGLPLSRYSKSDLSPDADEGNDECDDVTEHVEAVRHQGHGVGEVPNHKLHDHVGGGEEHHSQQLAGGVPTP